MKTENLYMVWAHPRPDSLTASVVKEMHDQAISQGINVTMFDLYRNDFHPVLEVEDEPDWSNPRKEYSTEVHQLYAELEANDTIMMVFPVWWFSFPAIMKGYLDRVWNHGLAYGAGSSLKGKKFRYVALVGSTQNTYVKYGWEKNITDYIIGMMSYLEVEDTKIDFLYNTLGLEDDVSDKHYQQLFSQARGIVEELNNQSLNK